MGRVDKSMIRVTKEREAMQKQIREKFGDEAIRLARDRLCVRCKEHPCFLLPITTKGEDCPYFEEKEVNG